MYYMKWMCVCVCSSCLDRLATCPGCPSWHSGAGSQEELSNCFHFLSDWYVWLVDGALLTLQRNVTLRKASRFSAILFIVRKLALRLRGMNSL